MLAPFALLFLYYIIHPLIQVTGFSPLTMVLQEFRSITLVSTLRGFKGYSNNQHGNKHNEEGTQYYLKLRRGSKHQQRRKDPFIPLKIQKCHIFPKLIMQEGHNQIVQVWHMNTIKSSRNAMRRPHVDTPAYLKACCSFIVDSS